MGDTTQALEGVALALLIALFGYRLAQLLVEDAIASRPRSSVQLWLTKRERFTLLYLTSCMQCTGFWCTALVGSATVLIVPVGLPVLIVAAATGLCAIMVR